MTDKGTDTNRPDVQTKPSRANGKANRAQTLGGKKVDLQRQKLVRDADTALGGALLDDVLRAREQNPPELTKAQLSAKYRLDILQVLQAFPDMPIKEIIKHLTARDPKAAGGQFIRNASASVKTPATAMRPPTTKMRGDVKNANQPAQPTAPSDDRLPETGVEPESRAMPPRPRNEGGSTTDDQAPGLFSRHSPGTR